MVIVITEEYSDGTPYFAGSHEEAEDVMFVLDSCGVSYTYYEAFAA